MFNKALKEEVKELRERVVALEKEIKTLKIEQSVNANVPTPKYNGLSMEELLFEINTGEQVNNE